MINLKFTTYLKFQHLYFHYRNDLNSNLNWIFTSNQAAPNEALADNKILKYILDE